MSYTTRGEVALFLNLDEETLTVRETAQIDTLILYGDGVIDNYCGYPLSARDYTDVRFSGSGTSSLDLNVYQVNAITAVREKAADGALTDLTSGVEILEDGFIQFKPEVGGVFTSGTLNFLISFNAGLPTIPTEVAYAATYLVAINFNKITQDLIGISEQGATGMATKYDSIEIPVLVKRVLDRYRKISIF